jgi:hypothetical protein
MMSNLYWLSEDQMAPLSPYFQKAMACRALMTGVYWATLFSSIALVCAVGNPPFLTLGDAHIFRFGFPGALDGFHVAWFGCSTLNGGRRVIGAVGLSDFRAFWPIRA